MAHLHSRTAQKSTQPLRTPTWYRSKSSSPRVAARTVIVTDVPVSSENEHQPIAICGHVDGGKSTTRNRVPLELGHRYEDDHEKEIWQSDGETVEKVMINEASTLVDTVIKFKAPEGFGSEKTSTVSRARMTRGRVLEQAFFRIAFRFLRKEGGQAWCDHRLIPERV